MCNTQIVKKITKMNKALLSITLLFLIGCAFAQREESSFWGNTEEDTVEEGPVRESSVVKKQVGTNNTKMVFCKFKSCEQKCREPIIDRNLDCVEGVCKWARGEAFPSQCVK